MVKFTERVARMPTIEDTTMRVLLAYNKSVTLKCAPTACRCCNVDSSIEE